MWKKGLRGRAISFLRIFVSNFRDCVFAVWNNNSNEEQTYCCRQDYFHSLTYNPVSLHSDNGFLIPRLSLVVFLCSLCSR